MNGAGSKKCSRCGQIKSMIEFHNDKSKKDGHYSSCRECWKIFYFKNRDIISERGKRARALNPEEYRKQRRTWRKNNRFRSLLIASRGTAKRIGYTPCSASTGEVENAFSGKCHICGRAEIRGKGTLRMDHDHTTGKLRGFLCHNCNLMLRYSGDSTSVFLEAIRYLRNE